MTHVATPKPVQNAINNMFIQTTDILANLYCRWQDEKKYEDFAAYKKAMEKRLPPGFKLVKATKSPFGFEFTVDAFPNARYSMRVNSTQASWKRVA